ncbi:hypothetical protein HED63_27140 [Ochrobactrum cytisi]|nr:hypothetical protein [Brucella cytisi]
MKRRAEGGTVMPGETPKPKEVAEPLANSGTIRSWFRARDFTRIPSIVSVSDVS